MLCWPSTLNALGAHVPGAGTPGWGAQCGALGLLLSWKTFAIVIILQLVNHIPGYRIGLYCEFILLTHLLVIPSLFLSLEELF